MGAAFRKLFSRYTYSARKRGFEFLLSEEEFKILVIGDCYYCGIPPNHKTPTRPTGEEFWYSGVDRIDSAKGYTLENCVSCCTDCNFMKHNLSNEVFITKCKLVAVKHA